MGLAQTSSSAQEKFWGSLLKKYGPTAARLAGHAIKAYMGLAQTSTTAVEKEKFLFAALAAAKLGYTAYKMFSLPQVANFKKADHYMALSQTATSVKEKEKFLFAALAAAKLGYTGYRMFSRTQTTTATAAQTKFWGSLLKKYGPTAARLAGHAIKAYMGLAQKGTIKSRTAKPSGRELDPSASIPLDARPRLSLSASTRRHAEWEPSRRFTSVPSEKVWLPLKRPARERRERPRPSAPPERPQEISPDSQLLEPLSSNSAPESSDPKSNAHARARPSA